MPSSEELMKFLFGSPTLKAYFILVLDFQGHNSEDLVFQMSQTPAYEQQKLIFNAFTMFVKLAVRVVTNKEFDLF